MFYKSQQLGEYILIEKLGRGGFGEVWLAEKEDELFAIKLPYKDQINWKQITQEIGVWTLCGKHKNVLPLIGAQNFDGQIALISEYAPDGSLEDLLKKKGKLSVEEAVEMTIGILEGLQHLHESGIIHRDLKPANILLNNRTPRLTDFGISRIITAGSLSETISGTWAYMAPECFDGKRNVQTDIWSIGVILYRMLTGNLPFPQKEQTAIVGAIIMHNPKPLDNELLQKFILKSLTKNSSERYQSISEINKDLDDILRKQKSTKRFLEIWKDKLIKAEIENNNQSHEKTKNHKEKTNSLQLIPYRKGDKWGFCDVKKNIVLEPKYDDASPFIEERSLVKLDGKYGYINNLGQEIIEIKYDDAFSFSEDLALISSGGTFGYINKNGKEVIECEFDRAMNFQEGLAYVEINCPDNKVYCGFINKNGEEPFEMHHFGPSEFKEGLCCVMNADKHGFIDKSGKTVISLIYEDASSFSEGLARVWGNTKYGFINKEGEKIHKNIYDNATDFIGGVSLVEFKKEKFFINKLGEKLFFPLRVLEQYDDFDLFDEDLIRVKISTGNHFRGKYGFIDKSGNDVIPVKYDWTAHKFISDIINVNLNNKHFYVGRNGTEYFED